VAAPTGGAGDGIEDFIEGMAAFRVAAAAAEAFCAGTGASRVRADADTSIGELPVVVDADASARAKSWQRANRFPGFLANARAKAASTAASSGRIVDGAGGSRL
jgi:hypothetical protein